VTLKQGQERHSPGPLRLRAPSHSTPPALACSQRPSPRALARPIGLVCVAAAFIRKLRIEELVNRDDPSRGSTRGYCAEVAGPRSVHKSLCDLTALSARAFRSLITRHNRQWSGPPRALRSWRMRPTRIGS